MTNLTILHLSDLHWSKAKANDQRLVIDALLEDLRRLKADSVIPDIIIFSGDLVQSADDPTSFDSVKEHFLDRLVREFPVAALIVVPGNHDIARDVVRSSRFVETGLKAQLNGVDELNRFVDGVFRGDHATQVAVARLDEYEKAYLKFGCPATITNTPLLKTYKIELDEKCIGVASFNTAWRATGEADGIDRHALLIGERHVDRAIEDLQDCDLRVAAFHHPLEWLADFDNISVSSRLYAEFDLICNGHVHRNEPERRVNAIGSAIISQTGCLYENRDYFNGYQFICFRSDDEEVDFIIRTYFNRPTRRFNKAVNIADDGKVTFAYTGRKTPSNGVVSKFLRGARPIIRQAAADQVNIVEAVNDLRLDPKEAFICPPLTTRRSTALANDLSAEDQISPEDLLRGSDNFLVVGPRECGKSTLAHYFAVLAAEGAIDCPRIPAVVDFRQLKFTAYGLGRAIGTYYGTIKDGLDIDEGLREGYFLVIVDNFSGRDKISRDALSQLIKKYPKCRWILMGDSRTDERAVQEQEHDALADFRPVHIQSLPRKSIRELSRRWCEQSGLDNQKAFSAVMDQLRDGNLPRTGYMVTLLLWALYQERQFERINEALLLNYVVDHLLGKADFTQALQRNFDPTSKEITLQHLASVLRQTSGLAPKNDVLIALIAFFKQKGLKYDASEVLGKLIDCGLLRDNEGIISFKYRCFEEYFYAGLMRDDNDKFKEATTGRNFVEYSRELELFSGLRRQNKDLLSIISNELKSGQPSELKNYPLSSFNDLAKDEAGGGLSRRRLEDIKKKKLTADQIDDLMDAVDREAAERGDRNKRNNGDDRTKTAKAVAPDEIVVDAQGQMPAAPMSPFEYVASIDLLGKVTRNSEFTDAADKMAAAKLHLGSSINVMLLYVDIIKQLIDSLTEEKDEKPVLSTEEAQAARYVLLKTFVFGTSFTISDQIGTEKLFFIFEEIFEEEGTTSVEQLMIAMMMLDLNHPKWLSYWDRVINQEKNNRLTLDLLMERLYHLIHRRPLTDAERGRVEAAAEKIEAEFGMNKHQRNLIVQSIRDAAKQTSREDDKEGQ